MFEYLKNNRFFAQTQRRVEPVAREELEELGARNCTEAYCGVYFEAPPGILYKLNYCARTIIRILAPLHYFSCPSENDLYKEAYRVPWADLFSPDQTFAIDSNVSNSYITHSKYAALRLKDAIADYFNQKYGKRPDVDTHHPAIRLNLNIDKNRATISLDTSGDSLHRRGYRVESMAAPMQETLAAAVIRLSGWNGDKPFMDPMCGSGTLLAEALMTFCRIPAGFKRKTFGFFHMPDFDKRTWIRIKNDCDRQIRPCPETLITGFDIDKRAVQAARQNLNELPDGRNVRIHHRDFRDIPGAENHVIVTNPPYGIRLKDNHSEDELHALYKAFGDFLKQKCSGSTAYILCGEKELLKHIGLKISRRIPLYNGPLDARLVTIPIHPHVLSL
ncbi:MAG: THUMP domain-containing class I SAM-dependent RNA methyltransferase [Candidatus Omnitrophota bacterium]